MSYKVFQIEVTNYCNAKCPGCPRDDEIRNLKLEHMTLETWNNILNNLDNVVEIVFNGNFGDCSMHPKIIEFLDIMAAKKSNMLISIHTNGGARNETFWHDLAVVLQKFTGHKVHFDLDGLSDTNHIHRINVNWEKLERNFKSFIAAGGYAVWRMIAFDHNMHQIDTARQMAKELGFSKFQLNRALSTGRDDIKSSLDKNEIKKLTKEKSATWKPLTRAEPESFIESNCPWKQSRTVQIDIDGIVWPCCHWQSNNYRKRKLKNPLHPNYMISEIIDEHIDTIDINKNSIDEIYSGFSNKLEEWIVDKKVNKCNACPESSNILTNRPTI